MNAHLFRFSASLDPGEHHLELLECAAKSHRPYHVMDTMVTVCTTIIMAAANLLLATETVSSEVSELRILLIPLMGAVIVSCGAILLNPKVETRNIVIGRAAIALLFGAAGPSAIGVLFESTQWLWKSPAVLLLAGGAIDGVVYVLSRPFFARLYERSDTIARREVRRLENLTRADTDDEENAK